MADTDAQPRNPERLEIEELTSLQPGLARLMPEIAARYWKAYYAAGAANWELAAWQLKELRKLIRICTVTRPKYAHDLNEWLHDDLDPMMAALEARDFAEFARLYHEGVDAANEYHRRWQKAFIIWKLPGTPPPDLVLAPPG